MSEHAPPPGTPGQPSQEEMQAALAQLREAPLTEVVLDIIQGLLSAAQVKIGRRDGRLLLDVVASVTNQVAPHVDQRLVDQVNQALTQLRMNQVEAEQQIAQSGEDEPNDLETATSPAPDDGTAASPPGAEGATSRLWIPGR
ncbi:MAG: hypothetical protein R3249_01565 [Nitriliruptorales bacterium]|nr:hypothetical protein [Nitriliruptorales bacterium]